MSGKPLAKVQRRKSAAQTVEILAAYDFFGAEGDKRMPYRIPKPRILWGFFQKLGAENSIGFTTTRS